MDQRAIVIEKLVGGGDRDLRLFIGGARIHARNQVEHRRACLDLLPDLHRHLFHAAIDRRGNQFLRCRGWLERFNGPRITVTHPEQIEVLED